MDWALEIIRKLDRSWWPAQAYHHQHDFESIDTSSGFSRVWYCLERHPFRRNHQGEAVERKSGRAGKRNSPSPS